MTDIPETPAMRCADCKYWNVNLSSGDEADGLYGSKRCGKAVQMWDAGRWHFDADSRTTTYDLFPQHKGQKMFVKDGSDYRADLYTTSDFFCAHFEKTTP